MSSVGIMNISMAILVVFESSRFTNLIDTVIINLFHYMWEFDLFIIILSFNDCLEI